jgi:hypothetical protein
MLQTTFMSREHYGRVDEQVSAAVRADMPESYRLERLALLAGHSHPERRKRG